MGRLANSYSGWSKRASRGYKNHGWNEDATRGPRSAGGAQPKTWADAEVEIVDEPDRSLGQTAPMEATDREVASATGSSSELHRLLNSRNGSLNATDRRNAEANDKAHDLNKKSVLALEAQAKICGL